MLLELDGRVAGYVLALRQTANRDYHTDQQDHAVHHDGARFVEPGVSDPDSDHGRNHEADGHDLGWRSRSNDHCRGQRKRLAELGGQSAHR